MTIYVQEEVYLTINVELGETDLNFVKLMRIGSCEQYNDFKILGSESHYN